MRIIYVSPVGSDLTCSVSPCNSKTVRSPVCHQPAYLFEGLNTEEIMPGPTFGLDVVESNVWDDVPFVQRPDSER